MPDYKAPLRDIRFVRDELLGYEAHYQSLPGCEDATPDMVNAILEEGAKFCEQVIAPLNRVVSRKPTSSSSKVAGRAWPMTSSTAVRVCRNPLAWRSAK